MKISRRARILVVLAVAAVLFAEKRVERLRIEREREQTVPSTAKSDLGIDQDQLLKDVKTLSLPEFQGRRTGTEGNKKAQKYILQRFQEIGLAPVRGSEEQNFSFTHYSIKGLVLPARKFKQKFPDAINLFSEVPGTKDSNHFLALTAHYDHLGVRDGQLYPGADDNASGVAAMLCAATYFHKNLPEHNLLFIAFDAEELGTEGSEAFLAKPVIPKDQILMDINMDMVSHNNRNEIFVAGAYQDPQLKAPMQEIAKGSRVKVLFGYDRPMYVSGSSDNWIESSDHYPFYKRGIPFLYFGVEDHEDYHAPTDTFDHINQPFFIAVTETIINTLHYFDIHPPHPM